MDRRHVLALGVLVAGFAFGLAIQLGDHALGPFRAVVWLGVPWLVAAFGAGAVAARSMEGGGPRASRVVPTAAGAAAGAAVLVVAVEAYYLVVAVRGSTLYAPAMGVAWGLAAAYAGAIFGAAGAVWRTSRGRLAAVAGAMPGAAATGEAVLLFGAWPGRGAAAVLAMELTAGLGAMGLNARRAHAWLALAAGVALVAGFVVAEDTLRETLRTLGWAGR